MTDAFRQGITYGDSTLQGGGTTNVQEVIDRASLPDIDLYGVWDIPFDSGSDEKPFGGLYQLNPGTPPIRSTGQLLIFQAALRDLYDIATKSIFDELTGAYIGSAHGTKDGIPYDLRTGIFEVGAIVETAPNEVGDRTLSLCLSVYNVDTLDSMEYIILDQSVLPTTSERSTLQMFSPRAMIDFPSLAARIQDDFVAAGIGYVLDPAAVFDGALSLRLHQTSGSSLPVYSTRLWLKKVQELSLPPAP